MPYLCHVFDRNGTNGTQAFRVRREVIGREVRITPHHLRTLQVSYEGMDQKQRAEFDAHLNTVANSLDPKTSRKIAGSAGIVALASMGGFATYTLLTTVMHAATFGALSFGAYTAAASALHLILGPVGWAAVGGWAIVALGGRFAISSMANMIISLSRNTSQMIDW